MTPTSDTDTDIERLWSLIQDIRFAMFTTRHAANGHLHARPMTTQNSRLDEDDTLWFFMSRGCETVADLEREPMVNVAYAHPGKDDFVSVAGEAEVVEDPARKKQLWSKQAEAWFPGGVDDPDLALVRVTIAHADYWHAKDSKVTQVFKMAKAAMTHRPPKDMSERGHVQMR